ncbi:MAG: hypothetical protein IT542_11200 [Rubellimicrobium sp.]|nr:hypothetical protein [Rubellimicrobium sp.]
MRLLPALLCLPFLAACAAGIGGGAPPAEVALDGNVLTLSGAGGRCTAAAPEGTGIGDSFSLRLPPSCPGVIEIAVSRQRGPSAHVVQIIPDVMGPLALRGQAPGLTLVEVTVMVAGGALGGYAARP